MTNFICNAIHVTRQVKCENGIQTCESIFLHALSIYKLRPQLNHLTAFIHLLMLHDHQRSKLQFYVPFNSQVWLSILLQNYQR